MNYISERQFNELIVPRVESVLKTYKTRLYDTYLKAIQATSSADTVSSPWYGALGNIAMASKRTGTSDSVSYQPQSASKLEMYLTDNSTPNMLSDPSMVSFNNGTVTTFSNSVAFRFDMPGVSGCDCKPDSNEWVKTRGILTNVHANNKWYKFVAWTTDSVRNIISVAAIMPDGQVNTAVINNAKSVIQDTLMADVSVSTSSESMNNLFVYRLIENYIDKL